jgi:hypothetical protein
MRHWLKAQLAGARDGARVKREWKAWRQSVLPRGRTVVDWMMGQAGPVTLNDDDAAAVAVYVDWLVRAAESD